jgi:hypothetical protein
MAPVIPAVTKLAGAEKHIVRQRFRADALAQVD